MLKINEAIKNLTVNSKNENKLEFVGISRGKFVFVYRLSMFNLRVEYDKTTDTGTYEVLPAITMAGKYVTVKLNGCKLLKREISDVSYSEFLDTIEKSIEKSTYEENGTSITFVFRGHIVESILYDEYIRYESECSSIVIQFPHYCPSNTCEVISMGCGSESKRYVCNLAVKEASGIRIAMPEDMNALV